MSNPRDIYEVPFKVLKFLGLWNVETKNPKIQFMYSMYQAYSFFFLSFLLVFCCIDLYMFMHDVQKASTNLTITISLIVLMRKNINILQNYHRVTKLKKGLRLGLTQKLDSVDRKYLMEGVKEVKHACVMVYVMVATTMSLWSFSPLLLEGDRKFAMPMYIPWPHDQSTLYAIAFIYSVCCAYYAALDVLTINLSFMVIVIGICVEYNILIKNAKSITKWYENFPTGQSGMKVLSKEENKIIGKMMAETIRHHQKIIHAINETEHSYVQMMLVQFLGGCTVLTVLALNFILASRTLDMKAASLVFMFSMISIDLFLFCQLGTRIINKNDEFLTALYDLPWEAMNVNNRKSVYIMMLRIKQPVRFTIQKCATLNLTTVLNITKAFYNLLYLLLHVAEKKNK